MNTNSNIQVTAQIGGYTIRIDKMDITLNEAEVIKLTADLLRAGCNLRLEDVMPTVESRNYVMLELRNY